MNLIIFSLLIIFLTNYCNGEEIMNGITKCRYDDPKCIKNTMNKVLRTKGKGAPEISLPSLDPIKIEKLTVHHGGDGPVNIKMVLKNLNVYGLSNFEVYKLTGFDKNYDGGEHELFLKSNRTEIRSLYELNGRILVLPIQGKGKCYYRLENPNYHLKFKTKIVTRNATEYLSVDKLKVSLNITRLYINFENLFNGDKALSDNTNAFINENWIDIYTEVRGTLNKLFGNTIKNILSSVFAKVPYKTLLAGLN